MWYTQLRENMLEFQLAGVSYLVINIHLFYHGMNNAPFAAFLPCRLEQFYFSTARIFGARSFLYYRKVQFDNFWKKDWVDLEEQIILLADSFCYSTMSLYLDVA